MSEENIFERDLDQTVANHQTQTPLSFLAWAASVYPDKAATGISLISWSTLAT